MRAPENPADLEGEPTPGLRPGDLLTVPQTLEVLPVGRSLLYQLLAEGAIPSIRVASIGSRRGRVLVLRRGLEAYVENLLPATGASSAGALDVDALRARVLRSAS